MYGGSGTARAVVRDAIDLLRRVALTFSIFSYSFQPAACPDATSSTDTAIDPTSACEYTRIRCTHHHRNPAVSIPLGTSLRARPSLPPLISHSSLDTPAKVYRGRVNNAPINGLLFFSPIERRSLRANPRQPSFLPRWIVLRENLPGVPMRKSGIRRAQGARGNRS